MTDLRQSNEYAKYLESINWKVEKIDNTYIYLKKLPLLGWYAKIQHPFMLNNKIINSIENNYNPFQFSVEPLINDYIKILEKLGFKLTNSPSIPTKTLTIDLAKSENELLKSFTQKTRYNIKLSQKNNIKIIKSENILDFTYFWRKNFEKKRFPLFSQQKNIIEMHNAFKKNSHILLAEKKDKLISALFILIDNKTGYYMYAASNNEGRKNFSPTLLTWNAILLTKKEGCKTFDFDGIYDNRFPIKTWLGFTKFKKGFGGKEIEYPGTFVKNKFNNIIKI